MAIEIERKFLVRDESWRSSLLHVSQEIRDGLIAIANGRKGGYELAEAGHSGCEVKRRRG